MITTLLPEYHPHRCTYVLWPNRSDNWREHGKYAQKEILELALEVSKFEPVIIGHNIPLTLPELNNISTKKLIYDDIWIRDTGPTYQYKNGRIEASGWNFNSWGGLLPEHKNDAKVAEQIATNEKINLTQYDLIFEGGNVTTDGKGNAIIVEEGVIDPNRNPLLSKETIAASLKEGLGIRNILWIPKGLMFDETGGHIDNICFFGDNETLFISHTNDTRHDNYDRSNEALAIIEKFYKHCNVKIVPLPIPETTTITKKEAYGFREASGDIIRDTGTPLCASYANCYVTDRAIFVPKFGNSLDLVVSSIIQDAMPYKTVVQIPSRELLLGGGSVHCVTKEVPQDIGLNT